MGIRTVLCHTTLLSLLALGLSPLATANADAVLQGQAEAALFLSPELDDQVFDVEVNDAVVRVSGSLNSADHRELVVDILSGLPGVASVEEDLNLQSGGNNSPEQAMAQQEAYENWQLAHISMELRQAFADSPAVDGENIEFSLDGNTLLLQGSVSSEIARTVASQLAQRLERVDVVNNQLEVSETSEPVEQDAIGN